MKKILIASIIGGFGLILLINGYVNGKQEVVKLDNTSKTQIEGQISDVSTTTSTIATTKKKTTKTVVKTTKKVTTQKVATSSRSEYESYAKTYSNYDDKQMNCLIQLWNHESGWNPNNVNKKSGACGIPQALPCSKIKKVEGSNDWKAQIRWGIKYINYRYKNPCGAWKHFQSKHWY